MSIGLDDIELGIIKDIEDNDYKVLTWESITPEDGLFLGLDISKLSTGICMIENGKKLTANITLNDEVGPHREVLLRRALKSDLAQLIEGKVFDAIVIEDAFVGENADTVRKLFALNTAIDEMILDGVCSCNTFIRTANTQWKSWLYTLDKNNETRGLNDKEKIRICLSMINVFEEGEGYQDRLDATGMLMGYFLRGSDLNVKGKLDKKRKVRLSDVEASYSVDSGYLFYGRDDLDRSKIEYISYNKIGKTRLIELLTDNPDKIFVTENLVLIGNLSVELNLDMIDGGGYLAFWIKPKRIRKYLQTVEGVE